MRTALLLLAALCATGCCYSVTHIPSPDGFTTCALRFPDNTAPNRNRYRMVLTAKSATYFFFLGEGSSFFPPEISLGSLDAPPRELHAINILLIPVYMRFVDFGPSVWVEFVLESNGEIRTAARTYKELDAFARDFVRIVDKQSISLYPSDPKPYDPKDSWKNSRKALIGRLTKMLAELRDTEAKKREVSGQPQTE